MFNTIKNRLYRLLRWSEKYTKTDMVYLASGGFWLTTGQAVSSLSAFALAIAFANLVPPETYGTYKYLLSIAALFSIFTLPGMSTAVARAVAKGHDGILHPATTSRVRFSLIGSFAALIGSGYYLYNGNSELSLALLIIAATLPFFDTLTGYLSYFVGKRRFNLQTIYHLITQLISVTTLVATLFITDNIIFILLAYFLPLALTRAALFWYTIKTIPKTTGIDQEKETMTYGKHLSAINVLGVIANNIDKILLWKFLGPAQLAIYAFAIAIPEQLKGPLKGVGELAFPKFAAQTPEQIRNNMPSLWRKLALYAVGLFGISFLYIFIAPYIFKLIFPQYLESVIYSQIISLSLFTVISKVLFSIIESQKKIRVQYFINIVQPTLYITLLLTLIPPYGVLGAIIAFLIGRIITVVMAIFITMKIFR